MTYESRRSCNCCRLAQCFRVGMNKSLIRSEADRDARKQLVEHNRKQRRQLKVLESLGLVCMKYSTKIFENLNRKLKNQLLKPLYVIIFVK